MTSKKLEEIFKDGYPINLFKNGDVFVGKPKNDNPDGPGYLIKADGTLFKGHFDEGIFNGPLVMISKDKKVFGGFIKGKKRGPEMSILKSVSIDLLFGFHRLAINGFQEDDSNQPFNIGNVQLVCNGEIYNYKNHS
mgnify:CR=1 FL=1